jgi:hypothetical protein
MWLRAGVGIVLCAVGAVWIGQGTNHIRGSFMTGHRSYAFLGGVLIVFGAAFLVWALVLAMRRGS